MARRLGTSGYYVMLPNLYYRSGVMELGPINPDPESPERKRMVALMNSISIPLVMEDTRALLAYAEGQSAANTRIVGTIPSVRNSGELLIQPGYDHAGVQPGPADRQLSIYDEAVRTVRSQVFLTDFDRRIKTLLFTSATAGEGKSTTASHLACAHAEQKQRTLLIDCDLRRPSQHKVFGIPMGYGLSNVLTGEMAWREVLNYPVDNPFLTIITAGPPSRRAADLIGSTLMPVLDETTQCYDLVVLDAPPLLGFAETLQLASIADGVIVVTHAGATNRKAVSAAIATLSQLRANVVGLVLNKVKRHHSDHYYYYGYYGKYYKRYQKADGGSQPV